MARLLSRPSRSKRFDVVMERINPKASIILDLGCGLGALTTRSARDFPSSLIVGIDKSKFLLRELQRKRIALTVLADIPSLPFKEEIFDVAIASQVLHEIASLKGTGALIHTFRNVHSVLRSDGEFVIFDHVSPGDVPILVRFSSEILTKFREFQMKFKHRKIIYQDHGKGLVGLSMRDFYDFLTKIWALNTSLEEEEMNETHTPFTRQELQDFLLKATFKVKQISYMTPIHLRKGIAVQSNLMLPNRQIVAVAKK